MNLTWLLFGQHIEMPNKNGVFHILNHMVRPRNTYGRTRGIVMKLEDL